MTCQNVCCEKGLLDAASEFSCGRFITWAGVWAPEQTAVCSFKICFILYGSPTHEDFKKTRKKCLNNAWHPLTSKDNVTEF